MEIVSDNPFQKVPLIRLHEPIDRPFEAADIERLLDALDISTLVGARDAAITLFLLDTGVRAAKLTSLDLLDVDLFYLKLFAHHGQHSSFGLIDVIANVINVIANVIALGDNRLSRFEPGIFQHIGNDLASQAVSIFVPVGVMSEIQFFATLSLPCPKRIGQVNQGDIGCEPCMQPFDYSLRKLQIIILRRNTVGSQNFQTQGIVNLRLGRAKCNCHSNT